MDNLSRVSLYRYGMKVCERKLLPFLIRQLEPLRDQGVASSSLPDVDPIVTEYELKETLRKYQVADYLFKYGLGGTLILMVYGLSKVFAFVSPTLALPNGLRPVLILVTALAIFVFWLGAYSRMKSRWEEWQEIRNMEISLEKIEFYAKATSSTIIAQLLVDIERIRETQKRESEKVKEYSAIPPSVMKTFMEMSDEKERRNRARENYKQLVFIAIGLVAGKGFDALWGLLPHNPNG
jgi:hypothetical protein